MSTYLVTGGAGFIGSHLVHALVARGERVRVVDNLSTGLLDNLPPAVEFIEGDLADKACATESVRGCQFVLHQAALASVPRSVLDPAGSHAANVEGTLNLLIAARDANCRRVVFAGSSAVYGDSSALPLNEDLPTDTISPYALHKHIGEQYGRVFHRLYGIDTVSVRYFNVFGPRQHPASPYSGVISLFIQAAVKNAAPSIYGNGSQTRDFTYVDNVVDGVLRATTAQSASGEIINIATGTRVSLLQVWTALCQITGCKLEPCYFPPRQGDLLDSQADIGKAERLLGYRPTVGFEEGLRRTVEWFRAGPIRNS